MKESIMKRIEAVRRGEVPEGYRRTRAGLMPLDWQGDLAAKDVFRNYTNKKHNGEFQVLSATQDRGIIPRSEVDIDIKFAEENVGSYKKVDAGDFVISLRSFQGGIEHSEYEGLVSPAYTVLKATRPISDNYYRAYFKTPDFISRLNGAVYGIRDGKQIGYEDFGELAVHYPPLAEQQKIAEILATCDRMIELKQQLLEEKRRQKQWLMQKLLDPNSGVRAPGFEGTEWVMTPLSNLCSFLGGGTPDTTNEKYWNGTIPWLSSADLQEGNIHDVQVSRYITEDAVKNSATKICPKNSILIVSRVGVGKIAIAPTDLCTSQDFTNLVDVKGNLYFITLQLKREIQRILAMSQGTSIKGIASKEIKAMEISLPSQDEQDSVARILECADKDIALCVNDIKVWQQKKKALMQLLLTGLVRV